MINLQLHRLVRFHYLAYDESTAPIIDHVIDLYNSFVVDSIHPAWLLPNVSPEKGQIRLIGSNFISHPKAKIRASIVLVLPEGYKQPSGSGDSATATDIASGALFVNRINAGELIVENFPPLPQGIYDIQLWREGEAIRAPK